MVELYREVRYIRIYVVDKAWICINQLLNKLFFSLYFRIDFELKPWLMFLINMNNSKRV